MMEGNSPRRDPSPLRKNTDLGGSVSRGFSTYVAGTAKKVPDRSKNPSQLSKGSKGGNGPSADTKAATGWNMRLKEAS